MALYIYPPTPVSVSVPPLEFIYDGASTQVEQDTANPANNRGLPVIPTYYKDGVPVAVNIDTITPANNRPLPVEIANVSGSVTINAGDLSVSTSAINDSMAIGDGVTGQLAVVGLNNDATTYALKVKDNDANTILSNINLDTLALSDTTGQAGAGIANGGISVHGSDGTLNRKLRTDTDGHLQVDVLTNVLPAGSATLAEQQLQTTELVAIKTAVQLLDNSANVDGNPIGTAGLAIGGRDSAGDFQQVGVTTAGELLVNLGSTPLATETTLSAINAKISNDFGAAPSAVRVAAQLGNPAGGADFGASADTSQTLRVSANLKRAGNELSYGSAPVDANSLRVAAQMQINGLNLDIGTGAGGPNTLRTLAILHDNDGDPIAFENVLNSARYQLTTNTQSVPVVSTTMGWDGTNRREILLDTTGRIVTTDSALTQEDAQLTNIDQAIVRTIAIPSGTKKFKVMASDSNDATIRMRVDNDPTATRGIQFQAGRSEDFECTGTQLRFLAEVAGASTQSVDVIFFKG